jgi:hypothetical protein
MIQLCNFAIDYGRFSSSGRKGKRFQLDWSINIEEWLARPQASDSEGLFELC